MPTIRVCDNGALLNSRDIRLIQVERRGGVYEGIAYCGDEADGYVVIRRPTYEEAQAQAVELAELCFGAVVWPPAKVEATNGALQHGVV